MAAKFSFLNFTALGIPAGYGKLARNLLRRVELVAHKKFKEVNLVFVGTTLIRQLNRVYRQHDKVTDVLSFTYTEKQTVGEVFICLQQAALQAKRRRSTLLQELLALSTHGFLHLLGYDHMRTVERAHMRALENKILQSTK